MGIAEILALIAFALREAPEILELLGELVKIVTPDRGDVMVDEFTEKAGRELNALLAAAKSTALAVSTIDFGKVSPDAQNQARFDDTVAAVKLLAAQFGHNLGDGDAETIAQNGWKLAQKAMP